MATNSFNQYSDTDLWQLITKNSFQAFDELYNRYWSKLYFSAHNVLKEQEASEDIVQEIFTQIWTKRQSIEITNVSAYLYGAVRNLVFKHIRSGNIKNTYLERINLISHVNDAERTLNLNELQDIYHKSLGTLPLRCREVFLLSREENLSYKEIASRLNISHKTVETQMSKALKLLRTAMDEYTLLVLIALLY